jgi:adenylate cyclase class IV
MPKTFEYEHRFSDFDMKDVLIRAKALGASKPQAYLMAYSVYSMQGRPNVYARVRDYLQGPTKSARTTLTVKLTGGKFDEEYESVVEDGEQSRQMLGVLGLKEEYRIEKMRIVIKIPGLGELDFDTAPGLPPYLEVECPSASKLKSLERALGLGPPSSFTIGDLYSRTYGATTGQVGNLTFHDVEVVRRRIRGRSELKKFDKLLTSQQHRVDKLRI